jgi:pyruvate/2-oxoglutarate dehydrogenase complex dihydrolipoamide acyltransferase (E2) component
MKQKKGYTVSRLSFSRKVVRASASVTKQRNAIHCLTEIDITEPRRLISEHFSKTGEKLSFTAYIVTCLARTVAEQPELNSFIRWNRFVVLDDITISVLIEREIKGEPVPEPLGIHQTQLKSFRQINDEIRQAQTNKEKKIGSLTGTGWFSLIPGFMLKLFIRLADRNITMAKRYGKVAVTAVGMFSNEAAWFIPHGTATVLLTIGSISRKTIEINGEFHSREHLCITVSFDHDIVDGAPAARFMSRFSEIVKSGEVIVEDV